MLRWGLGRELEDVITMDMVSYLRTSHASVCNLSVPGATAEDDLANQVTDYLCSRNKSSTSTNPKEDNYVFFFGINDCGNTEECLLSDIVENIIQYADRLYSEAGARKFIFIDVPPIDRSPGGLGRGTDTLKSRVDTWNEELRNQVSQFIEDTPTATVSRFSIHGLLSAILDDPEGYDFTESDSTEEGGAIWADELHLTSEVHKIIFEQVSGFI
ncbi:hypothetical protein K435DRAFT_829659 [Dendrothele bispora CBS 962.96]|uniref:Carbohydrate esterase family 16 protein n=1 Tax=Dendrothele bispora (strain CBS 962.96) TaxID=1314807 RepID=A0A4S8LSS3_DENBC|nr:hypothetical protein K435DRAFT_829659 [Dendrothele bispora CBS 962.96]